MDGVSLVRVWLVRRGGPRTGGERAGQVGPIDAASEVIAWSAAERGLVELYRRLDSRVAGVCAPQASHVEQGNGDVWVERSG